MPTIPAIPGNAGGAGIGKLKNEKTAPTKDPVKRANKVSLIT